MDGSRHRPASWSTCWALRREVLGGRDENVQDGCVRLKPGYSLMPMKVGVSRDGIVFLSATSPICKT